MKIRSEIDPTDQTCYQDQSSHPRQHRPTSTSCTKPESVQIALNQLRSPPCKHSSAAVTDSCLATPKAESTLGLSKPAAEPSIAGSLTVQTGPGVMSIGAIAKATQRYGTSSNRTTAIAQAGANAKRKSPSRSTVKPGALATLNAKAAAFSPSASHHRADAPLSIITEAEEHAARTGPGHGHTKTADAAALSATDQESASRAAIRVKAQSMLPDQALATRTETYPAAAQQADSKSVKTVAPSSSLPWDALANHLAASANPGAASANPWAASANPGAASANTWAASANTWAASANPWAASGNPWAASASPGAASANPGAASANPGAASGNPGAASANPGAASTSPAFAWPRPFQPPGSAETVSGISHSTRPESTSVTLDQSYPAAAVVQAEAAWEPAAVQAVAAPAAAAASGMTASAASRFQVQARTSNALETSALRDVFNQQPRPDPAVPHALPAKPQPGKKKHDRPRVSRNAASQTESVNNTATGLGLAGATSVQPHYSSSDKILQHLAHHASTLQNPARKTSARHDLDSFKQVWSELRGSDCEKEECPFWDDESFLQSNRKPVEAEYFESFLQ